LGWYPLSVGEDGWLGEFPQLAAIDKGLQDVLLDIVIVVDDSRHPLSKFGKVLDVFVDSIVVHVIGGRLGSQYPVVANILLGESVSVVTPDDRIGQVEILDYRLQLPLVFFGHFATEDHGDLLGLPDGAIQVQ
jgi:hypothetical protein